MKKIFPFIAALLLTFNFTIPAFAAENSYVYDASFVPPIPSFVRGYGHWYYGTGAQITCGFTGKLSFDYYAYPQDDAFPIVVLLSQGCYNKYNEENGIDYDREYSLYYILLRKYHGSTNGYTLGSFLHKGGPQHTMFMGSGNCMEYVINTGFEYSFVKLDYNWEGGYFENYEDMHHVPQGSLTFFPFAYVLGVFSSDAERDDKVENSDFSIITNGEFSESSEIYPNFGAVDGHRFDVGTIYYGSEFTGSGTKAVPHYRCHDWWFSIQGDDIPPFTPNTPLDEDTNGDGKPDLNVDTNGDGKPDVNIDINGDGLPEVNIDSDGDGKPDLNIDTDGDGKPDTNLDTDEDGKPDQNIGGGDTGNPGVNIDTDGDGKPDLNIDIDGDGKADQNVDIDGDGKPDVNVQPGSGGSSGGGTDPNPGGSSGGSGPPSTWFEEEDSDLTYSPWEFFNPFKFDYTPFQWNKNYDPLEGYTPEKMPDFPSLGNPNSTPKDPFDIPNEIRFKDFVIHFGGQ